MADDAALQNEPVEFKVGVVMRVGVKGVNSWSLACQR